MSTNSFNLGFDRQLETYDDFADDAMDVEGGAHGLSNGHATSQHSNKISLITGKQNKSKV